MEAFIDSILGPVIDLLQAVDGHLSELALGIQRGIDLGRYLGPLAHMGPGWIALAATAATGAAVVVTAGLGRAGYSLYLSIKAGVKWW